MSNVGLNSPTLAGQIAARLVRDFRPLRDIQMNGLDLMFKERLALAVSEAIKEIAQRLPAALNEVAETFDDPTQVRVIIRESLTAGTER